MMSPQCYQSPCPTHCLGILPDPSVMMTDSFSIGRTLATRFGALVFLYRQNNFLSTTGKSKMLSRTPEDAWVKRTTEGLRVPPLWMMTLEKSLKTWQAWTALTRSLLWVPSPTLAVPLLTGLKMVIIRKDQNYQSALLTVHRVAGSLWMKKDAFFAFFMGTVWGGRCKQKRGISWGPRAPHERISTLPDCLYFCAHTWAYVHDSSSWAKPIMLHCERVLFVDLGAITNTSFGIKTCRKECQYRG